MVAVMAVMVRTGQAVAMVAVIARSHTSRCDIVVCIVSATRTGDYTSELRPTTTCPLWYVVTITITNSPPLVGNTAESPIPYSTIPKGCKQLS